MLRKIIKTVNTTVNTVTKIIILNFGNWGSANSPILAVPAVRTVDKHAIEVTCNGNKDDYFFI